MQMFTERKSQRETVIQAEIFHKILLNWSIPWNSQNTKIGSYP